MAKLSLEKRLLVYARDGWRCRQCGFQSSEEEVLQLIERARRCNGRQPNKDRLTIDHVRPLAQGGSSHISNLQTLCAKCNHVKADKPTKLKMRRTYDRQPERVVRDGRFVRRHMGNAAGVGLLREHPALVALAEQVA